MNAKQLQQQHVCNLVRDIEAKGYTPWQISQLINEIVSPRTIERWIAGSHPPKNTKAVLPPLESLWKILTEQKNTTKGVSLK